MVRYTSKLKHKNGLPPLVPLTSPPRGDREGTLAPRSRHPLLSFPSSPPPQGKAGQSLVGVGADRAPNSPSRPGSQRGHAFLGGGVASPATRRTVGRGTPAHTSPRRWVWIGRRSVAAGDGGDPMVGRSGARGGAGMLGGGRRILRAPFSCGVPLRPAVSLSW
jgi:hypothetical protein